MSEILLPGILHRETEFVVAYDPVLKTTLRRFGTCGQQAAHGILTNVLNRYVSTAEIYGKMRAAGLRDASGASTAQELRSICLAYGAKIAAFRDWTDANWTNWQDTFNQHAGHNPFLYETHNGQALVDLITGKGENATNLQNHYVAVYGRHEGGFSAQAGRNLPAGYWCADGASFAGNNDNAHGFDAANVLQFYSDVAIAASLPRALVALVGRAPAPMAWHKQADGTGRDDKGHTCGTGVMALLESRPDLASADSLMGERFRGSNDAVLPLANAHSIVVHHDPTTGKWDIRQDDAAGMAMLVGIIADGDAQVASLKQQLAAAQSTPHDNTLADEALDVMTRQSALFAKLVANITRLTPGGSL